MATNEKMENWLNQSAGSGCTNDEYICQHISGMTDLEKLDFVVAHREKFQNLEKSLKNDCNLWGICYNLIVVDRMLRI